MFTRGAFRWGHEIVLGASTVSPSCISIFSHAVYYIALTAVFDIVILIVPHPWLSSGPAIGGHRLVIACLASQEIAVPISPYLTQYTLALSYSGSPPIKLHFVQLPFHVSRLFIPSSSSFSSHFYLGSISILRLSCSIFPREAS